MEKNIDKINKELRGLALGLSLLASGVGVGLVAEKAYNDIKDGQYYQAKNAYEKEIGLDITSMYVFEKYSRNSVEEPFKKEGIIYVIPNITAFPVNSETEDYEYIDRISLSNTEELDEINNKQKAKEKVILNSNIKVE